MRYRFSDGYEFEAESPEQILEELWQSKFVPEPTIEEWMEGFAKRLKMWDGTVVRTGSVEELVEDLLTSGHLALIS